YRKLLTSLPFESRLHVTNVESKGLLHIRTLCPRAALEDKDTLRNQKLHVKILKRCTTQGGFVDTSIWLSLVSNLLKTDRRKNPQEVREGALSTCAVNQSKNDTESIQS
ncbi:hypothetical protein E3Q22_01325, partial [Wallemia mellicola]